MGANRLELTTISGNRHKLEPTDRVGCHTKYGHRFVGVICRLYKKRTRMNYRVLMPFESLPVSEEYLRLIDRVGSSHRSIDANRRTNGDRRVSVRVTQAQYEAIVECALTARMTVADYVRHVLGV